MLVNGCGERGRIAMDEYTVPVLLMSCPAAAASQPSIYIYSTYRPLPSPRPLTRSPKRKALLAVVPTGSCYSVPTGPSPSTLSVPSSRLRHAYGGSSCLPLLHYGATAPALTPHDSLSYSASSLCLARLHTLVFSSSRHLYSLFLFLLPVPSSFAHSPPSTEPPALRQGTTTQKSPLPPLSALASHSQPHTTPSSNFDSWSLGALLCFLCLGQACPNSQQTPACLIPRHTRP